MTDEPWTGDACSLVDAFRSGERSPVEELEATLAAIDRSELNAFVHLAPDQARAAAAAADVSLPFGGVPVGIKALDQVAGWPDTDESLVFADRVATYTSTYVDRLQRDGGIVAVGQTLASEFGGMNCSTNRLHGTCHNPWQQGRTAGGSSGGSSAAVAGGLVTIATGGDGGGSIRIPAGFCGLLGMKGTAGRIPRGPKTRIHPMTVVVGCQARSVRDVARWYDVTTGYDARDPYSLPRIDGWERDLGSFDLAGRRVAIVPAIGGAIVRQEVQERVVAAGEALHLRRRQEDVHLLARNTDEAEPRAVGAHHALLDARGTARPAGAAAMLWATTAGTAMAGATTVRVAGFIGSGSASLQLTVIPRLRTFPRPLPGWRNW